MATPQPHGEAVGCASAGRTTRVCQSSDCQAFCSEKSAPNFMRLSPARRVRAARIAEQTSFAQNTETFSAVHNISVGYRSRLARSPGGLGGRSRIEFIVSPLPRRRHNESHFAAQSPERAFLAKPFFARAKNGVNSGRRSHKISVGEAKCYICRHKRAGALHLIRRRSPPPSPRRGRL